MSNKKGGPKALARESLLAALARRQASAKGCPRGSHTLSQALNRQEFVVIGWSDPEGSRPHLGALLLGYHGRNFQVRSGFLARGGAIVTTARSFARRLDVLEAKPMAQDFIFAHDVILDPDTAKVVAVVRNGGVWRDGTRIAVLVGAHMYDLNGNLLGKLAAGDGSLPISFRKLVEGKSAHAEQR